MSNPDVMGTAPRDAVREFIRALGVDPGDVRGLWADPFTVSVEIYMRDADGEKLVTPGGDPVTYDVKREIV